MMELESQPKFGNNDVGFNDNASQSSADASSRAPKRMKSDSPIGNGSKGHSQSGVSKPYHHPGNSQQQSYGYGPQQGGPHSQQPPYHQNYQPQMYNPNPTWQQGPPPPQGPGGHWQQHPHPQHNQMGIFRQQGGPPPPPPPKQDPYSNRSPPKGGSGGDWQQQQQWGNQPARLPPMMGGGPGPGPGPQGPPPPPPQQWGSPGGRMAPGNGPPPGHGMPQHVMGHNSPGPWRGSSSGASMCYPSSSSMNSGMVSGTPPSRSGNAGRNDDESTATKQKNKDKDKGRGKYLCGRCGKPKNGHKCPYQPKVKRRPDEPPPEMKNACVQVELDEFMILRRLNLEIQGFPESYQALPDQSDNVGADSYELEAQSYSGPPMTTGSTTMVMGGTPGQALAPSPSAIGGDMGRST